MGTIVTTAAAVANAFLDFQAKEPKSEQITPMKLQKLVFYAHAWWLAINEDSVLFEEDIQAWPYGPVIRSLYMDFCDFGRNPIIGKRATSIRKTDSGSGFEVFEPSAPEGVIPFLRAIWDTHKKFSGVQLSNATHAVGEPWTIIKDQYQDLEKKPLIPNEVIKDAFRRKIKT